MTPFETKQHFHVVETYLFNESFILTFEIRIFVYRKQYSFIYSFFLLVDAIISSKICFHQPRIRIYFKNTFPLDGKKTSSGLRKMEKKIISTSQKVSCQLAGMSSFSENCSLLIPKTVFSLFYQQWNSTDQKVLFPLGRKSSCSSRLKDIEKYVYTIGKSCFEFKKPPKKLKILVSTSKNMICL